MSRAEEMLAMLQAQAQVQPTWLDRNIANLFPGWGARRLVSRTAYQALGGAWAGARSDPPGMRTFNPALDLSPDEEQLWDRDKLLARSADLERNDPVAGGAIAEMVTSVVGTGLSLHPEPLRKVLGWSQDQAIDWAEERKERFNLWAEDARECDIARRRNFYQGQSIAYKTVMARGDAFALLLTRKHPGTGYATKFQLVEGDRCRTPRGMREGGDVTHGVEVDEFGGFKRYWFSKKYAPGGLGLKKEDFTPKDVWDKDGRRQVLHLFHEHRLDVRRGYPLLAPIIVPLKQMSRLSEAELAAAVVTSFFAVAIKKSGSGTSPLSGMAKKDAKGNSFTELGPAIVAELNQGEDIVNINPTRPNGAFDPFWRSMIGQLALRIQIPPEVLFKKFESSYTAARAALLQFWKKITCERENLLAPDFCQPIYERWLAEDVSTGGTRAPGFFENPLLRAAYSYGRWVGDNPPILDPLKEVMAAEELIDYGLSTHAEQTMRLTGGDFEANTERLIREVKKRRDGGLITDLKPEAFGDGAVPAAKPGIDPNAPEEEAPAVPTPSKRRRGALLRIALGEDK